MKRIVTVLTAMGIAACTFVFGTGTALAATVARSEPAGLTAGPYSLNLYWAKDTWKSPTFQAAKNVQVCTSLQGWGLNLSIEPDHWYGSAGAGSSCSPWVSVKGSFYVYGWITGDAETTGKVWIYYN